MKFEFCQQIFEKVSNIKFNQNPSSGRRVVACGQTDGRDEANRRFSQFCEKRLLADMVPLHVALRMFVNVMVVKV